jgi:CheY-like chemotaxis protein
VLGRSGSGGDFPVGQTLMSAPPSSGYSVRCHACGQPYNAVAAAWCSCLASTRSPVCPACGKCSCAAPKPYRDAFWEDAPADLFRRRHLDRQLPAPEADPADGRPLKRPLVLVADDDKSILRVATLVLDGMGYGVLLAHDGAEAIRMAKAYRPDLILTDALMPKMDGREVCRRLKGDPETRGIKVVIMTAAFVLSKYKSEAMKDFQADDYLLKPVDYELLQALLLRHLRG